MQLGEVTLIIVHLSRCHPIDVKGRSSHASGVNNAGAFSVMNISFHNTQLEKKRNIYKVNPLDNFAQSTYIVEQTFRVSRVELQMSYASIEHK